MSQPVPFWAAVKPKRPRMIRVAPRPFVPTERDFDDILAKTGLCRYLSADQIARDSFPSLDRARRRIRLLFDAGYLDVRLTTSTAPNLLSLTRQGLDLLLEERPELAGRVRLPGALRLSEVERHLAHVDARLFAAAWGAAVGMPLRRWITREEDVHQGFTWPDGLDPDAVAEFDTRPQRFVALEVAVTPEARRGLERRCELYALARPRPQVWAVVRDQAPPLGEGGAVVHEEPVVLLPRSCLVARPVERRPLPVHRAVGPVIHGEAERQGPGGGRCLHTEGRR